MPPLFQEFQLCAGKPIQANPNCLNADPTICGGGIADIRMQDTVMYLAALIQRNHCYAKQ